MKMHWIICALLGFSTLVHAGGSVGNGGKSITCQPSTANALAGSYSLDYVLTGGLSSDLRAVTDVHDSLQHIAALLVKNKYLLPYLDNNLQSFIDNLYLHLLMAEPKPTEADATAQSFRDPLHDVHQLSDDNFSLMVSRGFSAHVQGRGGSGSVSA